MDLTYITSFNGILKVLEIIFGLLCWALTANISSVSPPHQFVMFTSVTSWLLAIIFVFIYVMAYHVKNCPGLPWYIIEFAHNFFWAVLYFIAACVSAAHVHGSSQLVAATVFAFFTDIIYVFDTFVAFKDWRGAYPWLNNQQNTGTNIAA